MFGLNFIGLAVIAMIWLLSFFFFPHLRREQLISSVGMIFLWPLISVVGGGEIAQLGAADLLSLMLSGGIAGTIYHIAFGQFYGNTPRHMSLPAAGKKGAAKQHWFWQWVVYFLAIVGLNLVIAVTFPKLGLGAVLLLSALIGTIYIRLIRKDLLFDCLMSGVLMAALSLAISILSGPGAPSMQNLYMSLALGLLFGPLYETVRLYRLHV